mgnify:FL=1
MSCTIPSIENKYRQTNPELADRLNSISIDTWMKVKNSNLFSFKENKFFFNKKGTNKRNKQDEFVSATNLELGAPVVYEKDDKVNVNALLIKNIKPGVEELFDSNPELADQVYSKILTNSVISGENLLSLLLKDNIIEKRCS